MADSEARKGRGSEAFSSHRVGIAAEAFAAAVFSRCGFDVSVQYGANQPEYDLIIADGARMLKVSVKGSKDGGWGLTQSYLQKADYHDAADMWLKRHTAATILCLVQFEGVGENELPLIYLATPSQVATWLKDCRKGRGDTVLRLRHKWGATAHAAGTTDEIPAAWRFSENRARQLLRLVGAQA